MSDYELEVSGMTCNSCESIVEQRVTALSGVARVDADAREGVVRIEGDEAAREQVAQRIEETGYDVVN